MYLFPYKNKRIQLLSANPLAYLLIDYSIIKLYLDLYLNTTGELELHQCVYSFSG